jgi:transposase
VDALGNPVWLSLTAGQKHDITEAPSALAHIRNANVIADKGYDSNDLIAMLVDHECVAVIPPRTCRVGSKRDYDRHLYKDRFLVEALFQKLKRNRRIAMRFEKLASHYLGMVSLAAALVWTL